MTRVKSIVAPAWLALGAALATAAPARADYLAVVGGPAYDQTAGTGFNGDYQSLDATDVNNLGVAVGRGYKWQAGVGKGPRAVRWDAAGAWIEWEDLGTNSQGQTSTGALVINDAGLAAGSASKYSGTSSRGSRAVRWNSDGTAVELGRLGLNSSSYTYAVAYDMNEAGTAVGRCRKYNSTWQDLGYRAVRWDAGASAATELGVLGTDFWGNTSAEALAVNAAGAATGWATKYVDNDNLGTRAVRWDAGQAAATELGLVAGGKWADAFDINDAGAVVGHGAKTVGVGEVLVAIRWDAGGTAATELDGLGTPDLIIHVAAAAQKVNNAGTAIGYSKKYIGAIDYGLKGVRWDAGGSAATELGNLGTRSDGYVLTEACDISDTGTIVGLAEVYQADVLIGTHAVLWGADARAIDLNSLIAPDSGWTLTGARAISPNGLWVAGEGLYDPDGDGPLNPYDRLWLLEVPEPTTAALMSLGAIALARRRRRGR